jgi:flagellar biosynthesis/type III secretory pathway protein FliH
MTVTPVNAGATVIKAGAVQMVYLERRAADQEREASATRQRVEVEAAYQSGLADGRRAAEADGLAAMPKVATALDRAITGLAEATAARAEADDAALVAYATEIARWILGRELAADPAAVLGRIEGALNGLSPNGRLVLRVAPETADLVSRWGEGRDADVIPDATLSPGEARIAAGDAVADLTWGQAFNRVQEAFGLAETAPPEALVPDATSAPSQAEDADRFSTGDEQAA